MTKRLVDIDDRVLDTARRSLGTTTIKDTVDSALRIAAAENVLSLREALSVLGEFEFADRADAW